MYKATTASKHLIRSENGPDIHIKYTVIISPCGVHLSVSIKAKAQLQAAVRCMLLALENLHAAKFANTDIRCDKCSHNAFCLTDLETAVGLGCKWDVSRHDPRRVSWSQITLTDDRYTAESDMGLEGQLLTHPALRALEQSDNHFYKELMDKALSLQQALQHVWLQP